MPFRYYLRVRYAECDAQKVVFNARYGDYIELATTEFLRALGHGTSLASGELDYQLVRQLVEWKSPARFDEVLEVRVHTQRLGTTSFTLSYEFRRAGEELLLATAETVYVLMEAHTLRKIPLPHALRATLEAGAAGKATDHAAYFSR
jgi:acyl-CoA thioester hydrolase